MDEIRILVGMPSTQMIPVYTARSLMEWQRYRKYPSQFQFKIDTYIEKARNELVWAAVDQGATHLMFIDSDMVFPSHAIDRMVEQHKDIIGGMYFGRMHPKCMAFHVNPDGTVRNVDPSKEHGVFEVDFVGTGFMLIDIKVFTKLEPPFFTFTYDITQFGLKKQGPLTLTGEDTYFCLSAKKQGFKVWVDTTFELGHVGNHTYYKHDWEVYQKDKELYERA